MQDDLDGTVWASGMMQNSEIVRSYRADLMDVDFDLLKEKNKRNLRGEPMPQERFPKTCYWGDPHKRHVAPGHLMTNGFYIVSKKCADALRSCDLGRTSLYQTELLENDRKTRILGEYYCINFGEKKNAIIIEKSRVKFKYDAYYVPAGLKPNDLTVRVEASVGSDLWADETLRGVMFMSGRLVRALRTAKVDKHFRFTECTLA